MREKDVDSELDKKDVEQIVSVGICGSQSDRVVYD